jgi:ribonuclease HI
MEDIWNITDRNWSPQYKETITAAIINLTNTIWFARNQVRFNNKRISLPTAISLIIANTCLSGNNTKKVASNSIRDFSILEFFKINIDNQNSPSVKEILWQPPLFNWVKCNIDGASKGNPGCSSCGGIFRNHAADFMLGFAEPIFFASSYLAELQGALRAIEVAHQMNWRNLWLETDSALVLLAFTNPDFHVSWSLRNRWLNALILIRQMNFIVSHVFREGNQVADSLANHCLALNSIMFWNVLPLFIKDSFDKNMYGFANYRILFG